VTALSDFEKGVHERWVYQDDTEHRNAFYVPSHGWYGGLRPALAQRIVEDHNNLLDLVQ